MSLHLVLFVFYYSFQAAASEPSGWKFLRLLQSSMSKPASLSGDRFCLMNIDSS